MIRILTLLAFATLFGAGASQAQYRDSSPPDNQGYMPQHGTSYRDDDDASDYDDDDRYDEEIYGSRDDRRHNGYQEYDERGYSRPGVDVGIFVNLGNDGRWFLTADFGWVWRPYAASAWRPYTDGRWVWTSYGWTWLSYEPFAWATYHYGYWNCDARLGWVWVPGYEWSACRVQWAYNDDYICWAPLSPPGYSCPRPFTTAGFNIWFTVGARHFCDPYPARYCVRPRYKSVYEQAVAYTSPDRRFVERYTGSPVRTTTVQFKHTTFARGAKGFPNVRTETTTKARSYSRDV